MSTPRRAARKIYAEVTGYGLSGDAYHITSPAPDGDGAFRSMSAALKRAGITPSDIDYINAHGTSTPFGDEIELGAVERLLGNAASKVSMSSTKSSIGHLLGAAGAVEAIFQHSGHARQHRAADDQSRQSVGGNRHRSRAAEPRKREINVALSNSFGFGGTNASVILPARDQLIDRNRLRESTVSPHSVINRWVVAQNYRPLARAFARPRRSDRIQVASMSERPPISPRSPRAALEPEQVPPPPKRSERARNPFVVVGNAIITIVLLADDRRRRGLLLRQADAGSARVRCRRTRSSTFPRAPASATSPTSCSAKA